MCIAQDKGHRYGGFTLLEITLAVAILGMMALAIFRFVSSNLVAVRLSTELSEVDASYSALARVLTDQFQELPPGQGMLLGEPFKFDGRARDEMTWICEAGPGLFTKYAAGEYSVTLRLRPMEKSTAMELGVIRESDDDSNPVDESKMWVPLLTNLTSMEIRYFDPRLNAWVDRWTDRGTLPHLVRLTITRVGSTAPWVAVLPLRRTPL
ncbi:MAG TPA: prepilin-type N-terminal cleavage/methylation domain-containing protein [Pyrinomonadaceae bacterium]|nr:prepilin-type N-terminal cleavage/methylation domain-containing protein [Pyrinomonadaceae bacterium]